MLDRILNGVDRALAYKLMLHISLLLLSATTLCNSNSQCLVHHWQRLRLHSH